MYCSELYKGVMLFKVLIKFNLMTCREEEEKEEDDEEEEEKKMPERKENLLRLRQI